MNLISVQDFLEISYRADLDTVVARWLRPIALAEMQLGYEHILDVAADLGCRQWLLDVRRRLNTHRVGAHWMLSDLLPRMAGRLGGRTRLAYLLAPVYLRDADADAAFPPPAYFQNKPFIGMQFIEEDVAIDWLRQEPVD